MIRVIFQTNLDKYRNATWPPMDGHVPAKGTFIKPIAVPGNYDIPGKLEVGNITYSYIQSTGTVAIVELWYNATDVDIWRAKDKYDNLF